MIVRCILKLGFRFFLGVYFGYKLYKVKVKLEQESRDYQENNENNHDHKSHNNKEDENASKSLANSLKKDDKSRDPEAQPIKSSDKLINIGGENFEVSKVIAEVMKTANSIQTPHNSREERSKTRQDLSLQDSSTNVSRLMSLIQDHAEGAISSLNGLQQGARLIVSQSSSSSNEEEESEKSDEKDEDEDEDEDENTSLNIMLNGSNSVRFLPILNQFSQRCSNSDSSECSYSS